MAGKVTRQLMKKSLCRVIRQQSLFIRRDATLRISGAPHLGFLISLANDVFSKS